MLLLNSSSSMTQAVTLEHSLRTELRSLREEMDESSFSRNINFKQLESIQAEVSPAVLFKFQSNLKLNA